MADNLGKVSRFPKACTCALEEPAKCPRHGSEARPLVDNPVIMHGAGCLFGALIGIGAWLVLALAAWVLL